MHTGCSKQTQWRRHWCRRWRRRLNSEVPLNLSIQQRCGGWGYIRKFKHAHLAHVRVCVRVCVCIRLYVYAPVCESRALQLVFYCLHLQTHTHNFRWLFAPSLSMRAALQQQSRLALVYSHLKLPPQRKPTSPTSAVFSKSETTCIFHFDSQRVAEMFQY